MASGQTASSATVPPAPGNALSELTKLLPEILNSTEHGEMWGVDLKADAAHAPTQIVLEKYLRANNGDPRKAKAQLTSALEWRKKFKPLELVKDTFDENKFADLGYVTVHKNPKGKETVITWNIYGAVKDNKATFGNVEQFIRWRAAIMELGVQKLRLNEATQPLPKDGPDPYQAIQVHDYLSVSFFRLDPQVKAATKETISTFSNAYPELLRHKYFVNVPFIMGWMYGAMKLFLAPATLKKFHPMSSGTSLAAELPDIASTLPKEYGGQGPSVKDAETVQLADLADNSKKDVVPEGTAEAPVAAVTEAKTEEAKPAEEAKTEEQPAENKGVA